MQQVASRCLDGPFCHIIGLAGEMFNFFLIATFLIATSKCDGFVKNCFSEFHGHYINYEGIRIVGLAKTARRTYSAL